MSVDFVLFTVYARDGLLFKIYLNDLLTDLERNETTSLAYADDLLIVSNNHLQLLQSIRKTVQWSDDNHMIVNNKKSGIIKLRVDRRTKAPPYNHIQGIPVVSSYKYLGVRVDDCAMLREQNSSIKLKLRQLKRQLAMQWANNLPLAVRFQAWHSLIHS